MSSNIGLLEGQIDAKPIEPQKQALYVFGDRKLGRRGLGAKQMFVTNGSIKLAPPENVLETHKLGEFKTLAFTYPVGLNSSTDATVAPSLGITPPGNTNVAKYFQQCIALYFSSNYPTVQVQGLPEPKLSYAEEARWNKVFTISKDPNAKTPTISKSPNDDVFETAWAAYEQQSKPGQTLTVKPGSIFAYDLQGDSGLITVKFKWVEALNLAVQWMTTLWRSNKYPICDWIPVCLANVVTAPGQGSNMPARLAYKRRPSRRMKWAEMSDGKYQFEAECRAKAVKDDKRSMGWSWYLTEILALLYKNMIATNWKLPTDKDHDDVSTALWEGNEDGHYAGWLSENGMAGASEEDYHAIIVEMLKRYVGVGENTAPAKDEELPINADAFISGVMSHIFSNYNKITKMEFASIAEFKAYMTFEIFFGIIGQLIKAQEVGFDVEILSQRDLRHAMSAFMTRNCATFENFGSDDTHWLPMTRNIIADETNSADFLFPAAWFKKHEQARSITFEYIDPKLPPTFGKVLVKDGRIQGTAYAKENSGDMYVLWDVSASDAMVHQAILPNNTALMFSFGRYIGLTQQGQANDFRKVYLQFTYLMGSLNCGKRAFQTPVMNIYARPTLINTLLTKTAFSSEEQPVVLIGERKLGNVVAVSEQPIAAGAPFVVTVPEPVTPASAPPAAPAASPK